MQVSDILVRTVLDRCVRQEVSLAGKTVLCAVSGGRDSMALLHLMLRLSTKIGFSVAAAHYNHRLRPTARRDEDFVRSRCAACGVPLVVGSGDVRAFAKESGASLEDAARTMRYAFLQEAAADCGADLIATAHHRRDNAETLLLHLLRGSGLNGLGGIPGVRGSIIRPLLDADRSDIEAYILENNIPYVEDETNQDTAYLRNRVRLELLPLLEEISPGCVSRMAGTAARLRADEDYLQLQCAPLIPEEDETGCVCVSGTLLAAQHPAIALRIIRGAGLKLGVEMTAAQTDAALRLRSGGCLTLGAGLRAVREGETLRFYRLPPAPPPMALSPGQQHWGDRLVTVTETKEDVPEDALTVVLRCDAGPFTISAWDGSGRLTVENGRRTVKRLLADHRIPPAQRERCPAIYAGGTLAAVFGAGTDLPLRACGGETKLVISLKHSV